MKPLRFSVPLAPAVLNANGTKRGWRASQARTAVKHEYMDAAATAIRESLGLPLPQISTPFTLSLIFVGGRQDLFGYAEGAKALVDLLCRPSSGKDTLPRLSIVVGDSPKWLSRAAIEWRKAAKGETPHVEILIQPIEEA